MTASFPFTTLSVVNASVGTADANAIPQLNTNGVLDPTLMNGTTTSTGVAQAGKTPILSANGFLDKSLFQGILTSAGAASSGGVAILNALGLIDASFLGSIFSGGGSSQYLVIGGWVIAVGTGSMPIPGAGSYGSSTSVTFAQPMTTCFGGFANSTVNGGVSSGNGVAVVNCSNFTGTGMTVSALSTQNGKALTVPVTFNYVAFGQK